MSFGQLLGWSYPSFLSIAAEKTPGATSDKVGSALRAARRASIKAEREEFTLRGNGETAGFLHTGPSVKPSLGDEKFEQECVDSSLLTEGKTRFCNNGSALSQYSALDDGQRQTYDIEGLPL